MRAQPTSPATQVRYCVDLAGLAHGPWRVWDSGVDPSSATPLSEGQYVHGSKDGVFIHRFMAEVLASSPDGVRFRQEFAEGLLHGYWQEFDAAGASIAEQHYDHGRRCGVWITPGPTGQHEEISFIACDALPPLPPASATEVPPARAKYWNGEACPAGTDRQASDQAVWCEREGKRDGPSLQRDEQIEIVGQWSAGLPHGAFTSFLDGRALRVVHYVSGRLEGAFARWYVNGQLAERGAYADDALQGVWESFSTLGYATEKGSWESGEKHGIFERFAPGNVPVEHATWNSGRREGEAFTRYDDGAAECSGQYRDNLREGQWTCLHPTGATRIEGPYVRGLRHGAFRGEEPDGRLGFEGAFVKGTPDGEWKTYLDAYTPDDSGRLVTLATYVNGMRGGEQVTRWVDTAVVQSRVPLRADALHGVFHDWYRSGEPFSEGEYIVGRREGNWRAWHRNGQLALDAHYERDVLHGSYAEYADDGTLKRRGTFDHGQFFGGQP